ncbi:MAG TPA: AarF/ABC1/UbiB kinase family protein [Myxococcota bacterium]|nr:AarF/ABC1/UbiB kinase family protein [Myxococcota bacterium]
MDESSRKQRTTRVPEGRGERIARLAGMLAGIAGESALEALRRVAGAGERDSSILLTSANARRVADTLADLRGAAMKLGQLLSLQGDDLLSPALRETLASLQSHAHFMPEAQVRQVLAHELGREWKPRFAAFDFEPLAAASIGQVHAATARDGRDLALKLQYPGVERSIDGDVDNLALLLRALRLVPAGLDLDSVLPELKEELRREADYGREARSQEQYRALVGDDPGVLVPRVYADLSTHRVLASDRVRALPIEDLRSPAHPQRLRDEIGAKLLRLVFRELFEFRFVQTDPNFGNYLYEPKHERVALLDFGSVRSFSRHFTDHYRDLIAATIAGEPTDVEERGRELGLLRGDESEEALTAFANLSMRVAEPLAQAGPYDFGAAQLAREVRELGVEAYTRRGLHAPPTELIFLHRKLAGTYLLLAHIGARVDCGRMFEEFAG